MLQKGMFRHPALVPLSHQHHDGLLLCVMNDRAPEDVSGAAQRIVDAFDAELKNHFDLEEELLFPESRPEVAAELLAEHRTLAAMADELRTSASAEVVARFSSLLRAHIRREEQDWFEELQRTLTLEKLERIGVEFAARAVRACVTRRAE